MGWENRDYHKDGGDGDTQQVRFSFAPLSRLTLGLMAANLAIFLFKILPGDTYNVMASWGALTFRNNLAWFQPWRWITYQYFHADAGHIFFNMLGVYFFLSPLENRWGWRKTLGFYTLGGIAAGAMFGAFSYIFRDKGELIGASGSVFALMGAVALFYPAMRLILLVFFVPIRVAISLFAILFLLTMAADHNLSDACHLGGLAFGFLVPWLVGPKLADFVENQKRAAKNREVQNEIDEQKEVDRILAKVGESGMNSLSGSEKKFLHTATENQKKRDAKRATARRVGGW